MPIESTGAVDSPAAAVSTPRAAVRDVRPQWSDDAPAVEPGVHDAAGTFAPWQYRIAKRLADDGASVTALPPHPDGVPQPDATIRWDGDLQAVPVVFAELAPDSSAATIAQRIVEASRALGGRRGEIAFASPPPGVPTYEAHLGCHRAVSGGEHAAVDVHFLAGREVFSVPYEVALDAPVRLLDDGLPDR